MVTLLASCGINQGENDHAKELLWTGSLGPAAWPDNWGIRKLGRWGEGNLEVITDPTGKFAKVFKVSYPRGSASPLVTHTEGTPLGGTQFYADLQLTPQTSLYLRYYVYFPKNFKFVRGGKLPGLFGGWVNSGGNIPDGRNGFSIRYMWREEGLGEVYAYLPTSSDYGTSIQRGAWSFETGKWYLLEQAVFLNNPGKADGSIRVWVDEKEVINEKGILFRRINSLLIEGIMFSTFFGGADLSWVTPVDTYALFACFAVSKNYIGHRGRE